MSDIKKKFFKLMSIAWVNTVRFNFYYFGIEGLLRPIAILSRNVKILNLSGSIHLAKQKRKIAQIKIGFHDVGILDQKYERSIWSNTGEIVVEGTLTLASGTRISNAGYLSFGADFGCSGNSSIICTKEICFGKHNLISWDVLIMDSDLHRICNVENPGCVLNNPQKIIFGDNVWIGCRSTILKGSVVADKTVIAAGSVIHRKCNRSNVVIGENGILKEGIYWEP